MRPGKVPENVRRRTIFKQLQTGNSSLKEDGWVEKKSSQIYEVPSLWMAQGVCYGKKSSLLVESMKGAAGDLWAEGVCPKSAHLHLGITETTEENEVKRWVKEAKKWADNQELTIVDAVVEVMPKGRMNVATASLIGEKKFHFSTEKNGGQYALVLTYFAGIEGTQRLLEEEKDNLEARFVPSILQGVKKWERYEALKKTVAIGEKYGAIKMRHLGGEGVLGGMYLLSNQLKLGLEAWMDQIPILQETIEICEFLEVNPYELTSGGSLLVALPKENVSLFLEELQKEKIPARHVGKLEKGNEKNLLKGEETSCLERPMEEALAVFFSRREES